jgi:hypothetical protein
MLICSDWEQFPVLSQLRFVNLGACYLRQLGSHPSRGRALRIDVFSEFRTGWW